MRKLLLCIIALLCIVLTHAQQIARGLTASNNVFIGFYEYKPTDYNADPSVKYPLIIFLHGIGERGNGTSELSRVTSIALPRYIRDGHPMRFYWNGKWETFLVLSPQLSSGYGWWQNFYVEEMIKYATQNLRIDTNRIFLTGISLGGGGVWSYAGESLASARKVAAIAPICGVCQNMNWCNISGANLPTWGFHSADDPVVSASCTIGGISNLNNCNPAVKPYMSIWPDGGHAMWDRALDYNYNWQTPNLYEWFLGQNKSLPVNSRPLANAGNDLVVSALPGTVNLSGSRSSDADGSIVRYAWRQVSGPTTAIIASPVSATGLTAVSGLLPGTYQFELKAIDDRADWSFDYMTVTVVGVPVSNIPPVSSAGQDQTIVINSTSLNGSDSYDPDGVVVSYRWTKLEGPPQYSITNETTANALLTNMAPGTYKFELEATDNAGATSKDTVTITDMHFIVPVKWLYFKGNITDGIAQLKWATADKDNDAKFEIERSTDGKVFEQVGIVQARTFSTESSYQFADRFEGSKKYYRLKQFNKTGTFTYSDVVVLTTNKNLSIEIFPNPADEFLTISMRSEKNVVEIKLVDMHGKKVRQRTFVSSHANNTFTMAIGDLPAGIYLLEVSSEHGRESRKVIKK